MRQLAILTTDDLEDFFVYDHLAYPFLEQKGWQVEEVSWHAKDVEWDKYEVVVIRSAWDYQSDAPGFLECLEKINASSAKLENSFPLVSWNISKDYLKTLEAHDIPIVPTLWANEFDYPQILSSFAHFETSEIVIKPLISANADHTYRLSLKDVNAQEEGLKEVFSGRPYMIQPFLRAVVNEGEYSLFYFGGQFSHCILKIPRQNDFRVQEEHGGQLRAVDASKDMQAMSERVLKALPELPLYARIDLIRAGSGFVVIEIELIEPSLYFNMDSGSAERFALAFCAKYPANPDGQDLSIAQ